MPRHYLLGVKAAEGEVEKGGGGEEGGTTFLLVVVDSLETFTLILILSVLTAASVSPYVS